MTPDQFDSSTLRLPARPAHGHKGTFGTVAVLGGQAVGPRVMVGGPAFTAHAALRSGAGLAVLAMPEPLLVAGLTIAPSATGLSLPTDESGALIPSQVAALLDDTLYSFGCLALGPGLGTHESVQQVLIPLIAQDVVPLVIDADAINVLATSVEFQGDLRAPSIWTPHPGEYARLARSLGMDEDCGQDDDTRAQSACSMAQRLGAVVVLKGHRTVVSDGVRVWVNTNGNVSMATAGSGDVLTGVLSAFVAQFAKPYLGSGSRQVTPEDQGGLGLFECACLGVMVHGESADLWAAVHGNAGITAMELADHIPDVLPRHRA